MEIVLGRNSKRAKGDYGSKKIDRISELPQRILQQILYFLSQEEAVRTSVLSKSWRNIWCTRPNLDFSDANFKGNKHDFLSVVDNTLQRYCDQKLCVEEFGLSILLYAPKHDLEQEFVSFLEKWIQILTIMGIKKFRICNRSERNSGFIHLPTIVFEAESLQDLHVENFLLDQKVIKRVVVFKHLKKLHLEEVCLEDEILKKIISSCPLVETLFLQCCKGLRNIEVNSLRNLKNLSLIYNVDYLAKELCGIEIQSLPSLETMTINHGDLWFHKGAEFRNLNQLFLFRVESSCHYLSSCKFPSLKHLVIHWCHKLKDSKLFIDAPNIVWFKYGGDFVPSISFATTSRKWYSEIYLLPIDASTFRFLALKELLKSLSQSKISLSIFQSSKVKFQDNIVVQDSGCDKDIVENLIIRCDLFSDFLPLLNGALSICRPRNIGNYNLGLEMEGIGSMWKFLKQRENGNCRLIQLRELEEVSTEIYNYNRKQWHPITVSELPNYKQETGYYLIRFPLKWRENYV